MMVLEKIAQIFIQSKNKKVEKVQLDELKELLSFLDYEPKIEIVSFAMPIESLISLGGESSRPRNPDCYIINSCNGELSFMEESEMVRYAVKAVRCRRQSGEEKLETFSELVRKGGCDFLAVIVSRMEEATWGIYDADAQVLAYIAMELHQKGVSLEQIKEIILLDASEVIEKKF